MEKIIAQLLITFNFIYLHCAAATLNQHVLFNDFFHLHFYQIWKKVQLRDFHYMLVLILLLQKNKENENVISP